MRTAGRMPCRARAARPSPARRDRAPRSQRGKAVLVIILERAACQLQRDDRVDQALLGPVVQIANHPSALLVGRRHDPRPRRRQVRPRLDVRDRGSDQLRGLRRADPRCAPGRRSPSVHPGRHHTPDVAVDEDRGARPRSGSGIAARCRRPFRADVGAGRRSSRDGRSSRTRAMITVSSSGQRLPTSSNRQGQRAPGDAVARREGPARLRQSPRPPRRDPGPPPASCSATACRSPTESRGHAAYGRRRPARVTERGHGGRWPRPGRPAPAPHDERATWRHGAPPGRARPLLKAAVPTTGARHVPPRLPASRPPLRRHPHRHRRLRGRARRRGARSRSDHR